MNILNRNIGNAAISIGLAFVFVGQVAVAQQGADESAPAPAGPGVEEVIVTAQHRTQVLRDVPLSMSVMSGEDIRKSGIMTFDDVARMAPNVSIATEDQSVYIRGFGSGNNALVEPSVGFGIDGIPYARPGYIRDGFLDVARIEVLRGPQGTLFGKNAVAGAVNVITADPDDSFGAQLKFAGGDINQHQVDLAAWGPLGIDGLSGRLAVASHRLGNYIVNTTQNKGEGSNLTEGARLKLRFEATDRLSILGSLQVNDQRGRGPSTEFSYLTDEGRQTLGSFDPTVEDNLDHRGQGNEDSSRSRKGWTSYIKVDYELGDWLLTSLTGATESEDFYQLDGDFSGAPIIYASTFEEYTQYNQELRVTSPPGDLEFVGGLFLYTGFVDGGNVGLGLNDANNQTPFPDIFGDLLVTTPPALLEPESTFVDFEQQTEAYALYGQLSYHLMDWWNIELGLRANYEVKSIDFDKTLNDSSVVLRAGGHREFNYKDDREEFDLTPKVSMIFDVGEKQTVYVTWAKGVKSGGYSAAAFNIETISFEPESSETWEVGTKGSFFDSRLMLNVSAFQTDFEDLQVTNFNGTFFVVSNAAAATAKGAEADFVYSPFSWLNITGAVGYNDATYNRYDTAPCPARAPSDQASQLQSGGSSDCELTGRTLIKAPMWNASLGLTVSVPLNVIGADFVFSPSYTWQDEMFLSTDLDPLDKQDDYGLVGFNLALVDHDDVWTASFNVSNLEDQFYMTDSFDVPLSSGSHAGFTGQPRRYLASFSIRI